MEEEESTLSELRLLSTPRRKQHAIKVVCNAPVVFQNKLITIFTKHALKITHNRNELNTIYSTNSQPFARNYCGKFRQSDKEPNSKPYD